jgi:hypothetical protein
MAKREDIPRNVLSELEAASEELDTGVSDSSTALTSEGMKIIHSNRGPESPFEKKPASLRGIRAYSGDYWGTFSLEKFASAGSLRYTHEDAWGWLKYLEKFHPRNFRYLDQNVRIWAYYEQYDNWQDTYGMDAVLAVYHSGHGGMTSDGRFCAPLGADWGGLGTTAWSDQMALGNEQVRYVFWSTCLSLRVLGGHSPIRTWSKANKGFRMLFGYETVSYDDPDYGSGFWKHWNKGKSFSTAFMDASWYEVSHNQAPSVVACGATQNEAKNRVFNERMFNWGAVSHNWWWWRWYNAAASASAMRALNRKLPDNILVAELAPPNVSGNYVKSVLDRVGAGLSLPREVQSGPDGSFFFGDGDQRRAAFAPDGSYEIQFSKPNLENLDQIGTMEAAKIAGDFVRQSGLDRDDIVFDRILLSNEGGGSDDGSGRLEGPFVTETTIQFTQLINGLPVLQPKAGGLAVTVDNDGNITSLRSSLRPVDQLTERLKNPVLAPDEKPTRGTALDPEGALAQAWQNRMKEILIRGQIPVHFTVVPGSYEIGYAIRDNEAVLVARNDIEVDCGGGFSKRYAIEVPLYE